MKTKLVIFGLTGDLGTRKLLPALGNILKTDAIKDLEIVGVTRREISTDDIFAKSFGADFLENPTLKKLREKTAFYKMNLTDLEDYKNFREFLQPDNSNQQILVYLSVPPSNATAIVDYLGMAGINAPNVKLMFEKPFGFDLESAREMIRRTSRFFTEKQIFRVDHFLAKEMAQNIVAMRYGNAIFSRIWDNQSIKSIDIVAEEEIGIEGRGIFYEQTGALRDILQGHAMQLLALVLCDLPVDFKWSELPKLRAEALDDLEIARPEDAFRAQYAGYRYEVNNPKSSVETAAGVKLFSRNPKFSGVPMRLLTGKNLARKATEIHINLKHQHAEQEDEIVFRIQPNEGVSIKLFAKKPGYGREFYTKELGFSFPVDARMPDAYEQVFVDAANDKHSLFASSPEIIRQWEILQPVLDAFSRNSSDAPLKFYAPGTQQRELFAKF